MTATLFCFGLGYTGARLAETARAAGWRVGGTTRDAQDAKRLAARGIDVHLFDGEAGGPALTAALGGATHLLSTIPPGKRGDPVLAAYGAEIEAGRANWTGYISTTGVYGDRQGGLVDEQSELRPTSRRAAYRVAAEAAWDADIFRVAGIYGPGRSALDAVKTGRARRIVKQGQIFSRIHIDDLIAVLWAAMNQARNQARPGAIYNVCDDQPAPPQDVIAYACRLLGVEPPPEEPFETAEMTDMVRSFYADNKRVTNDAIKRKLGVTLTHPDYKSGLDALFAGF